MPVPTYLIILLAVVLSFALGMLAIYLYFRGKIEEHRLEERTLRRALRQRNEDLLKYQRAPHVPVQTQDLSEAEDTIHQLREEVEQKNLELSILRQDYELDTSLLKNEVEQLRARSGSAVPVVLPFEPEQAEPFFAHEELSEQNGDGDRWPAFVPLSALFANEPASEQTATLPARAPGEDLTRIQGIDERLQDGLNALGISSIEQMSRWNHTEVHRVSRALGIPAEQILQQWIPQAQMIRYEG